MRYAPDHKRQSRARIFEAAERAFRVNGFSFGVDRLMAAVGLTSGAFYVHFRDKSAVIRAVVIAGLERLNAAVMRTQQSSDDGWVRALTVFYLGKEHRRNIAAGCALPSLSGEVVRADRRTRRAYQKELVAIADLIASRPPLDQPDRAGAWPLLAMLAGGTIMARAVADESIASEIATAVETAIAAFVARSPQRS
jgi:TetR/AcrR family transcriptional regulator, transcriptional repressor for nem operon